MLVTQEFFYCDYSFSILIKNTTIIKDRYLSHISNYTTIFRSYTKIQNYDEQID